MKYCAVPFYVLVGLLILSQVLIWLKHGLLSVLVGALVIILIVLGTWKYMDWAYEKDRQKSGE
jgi:membrane protein YdbS with pleckstrin-like domain